MAKLKSGNSRETRRVVGVVRSLKSGAILKGFCKGSPKSFLAALRGDLPCPLSPTQFLAPTRAKIIIFIERTALTIGIQEKILEIRISILKLSKLKSKNRAKRRYQKKKEDNKIFASRKFCLLRSASPNVLHGRKTFLPPSGLSPWLVSRVSASQTKGMVLGRLGNGRQD